MIVFVRGVGRLAAIAVFHQLFLSDHGVFSAGGSMPLLLYPAILLMLIGAIIMVGK